MSDRLTSEQIQELLKGTTQGPWGFREHEEWEHVAGHEYPAMQTALEHDVHDVHGESLFGAYNNHKLIEYPGNLHLAAAAPALAATALHQAEQIKRLQQALHKADKWGDCLGNLYEDGFITEEDMQ